MTPLYGHAEQQKWLMSMIGQERLHHGLILAGRKGLGKFLFAQHGATALLSQEDSPQVTSTAAPARLSDMAAAQAERLVEQDHHPDLHVVRPGPRNDKERKKAEKGQPFERSRNISVDQIRELQRRFSTRPTMGRNRVIIIDAADNLERAGANALLKSLEEPSANTYFFLVSHNPGSLLPTIRSRCQILRFEPLPEQDMQQFINAMRPQLHDTERAMLVQHSGGIPGDIAALDDKKQAEMLALAQRIVRDGDADHTLRAALASATAKNGNLEAILAMLRTFPPLLADCAKASQGPARQAALDSWSALRALLDTAPVYNYDNQALIFHIAGLLAEPARIRTEQS